MDTKLAITVGEPAGVGPDLALLWAQQERTIPAIVLADPDLLRARATLLGLNLAINENVEQPSCGAGELTVKPVFMSGGFEPGIPQAANVPGVLACLDDAIEGCLDRRYAGVVTAPMQKSIVNEAGIEFSGHTEYFARATHVDDFVMLLVTGKLRVALATTHLPVSAVSGALTQSLLRSKLATLRAGLVERFGLNEPRIAVTGLNPHAGEGGHLGREEIEIIEPVVAEMRGLGIKGPYPADTIFTPKSLEGFDAVLAMFHDQGLPVLKYAGFGRAVNVTLGLPIVRTSVDHGTALDIAGSGQVDSASFNAALQMAWEMAERARA